jgi:hypothetical protein
MSFNIGRKKRHGKGGVWGRKEKARGGRRQKRLPLIDPQVSSVVSLCLKMSHFFVLFDDM